MTYKKASLFLFATLIVLGPVMAHAQSAPKEGLIPPTAEKASLPPLDSETHPPLKLTPDKSQLVKLDRDAASVIVGNPSHVTVLLDTPKLAVVVPRKPGATYFTVLDKEGNVIMQRHAIVASPAKNYVRIRRSCGAMTQGTECKPTSVYFCPDMCHEIGAGNSDDASTGNGTSE